MCVCVYVRVYIHTGWVGMAGKGTFSNRLCYGTNLQDRTMPGSIMKSCHSRSRKYSCYRPNS